MKNIGIIFLLLTLAFSTSCKKDWQCECKEGNIVVDVVTINDVGKRGAKDICQTYEDQNNSMGAKQICKLQ